MTVPALQILVFSVPMEVHRHAGFFYSTVTVPVAGSKVIV